MLITVYARSVSLYGTNVSHTGSTDPDIYHANHVHLDHLSQIQQAIARMSWWQYSFKPDPPANWDAVLGDFFNCFKTELEKLVPNTYSFGAGGYTYLPIRDEQYHIIGHVTLLTLHDANGGGKHVSTDASTGDKYYSCISVAVTV